MLNYNTCFGRRISNIRVRVRPPSNITSQCLFLFTSQMVQNAERALAKKYFASHVLYSSFKNINKLIYYEESFFFVKRLSSEA